MARASAWGTMISRTIAREWLYLLGFVVASLLVVPFPVMLFLNPRQGAFGLYKALFDAREWWVA
jgi:hypothetical protein